MLTCWLHIVMISRASATEISKHTMRNFVKSKDSNSNFLCVVIALDFILGRDIHKPLTLSSTFFFSCSFIVFFFTYYQFWLLLNEAL